MEPGFKELVQDKWNSYCVKGDSISKLKDKLEILKADLKVWNREVFGCLDTNKKMILKEIEDLDIKDDKNLLDDTTKLRRLDLISQLKMTGNKIESLCRQKARTKWLKHGDSNSKYYPSVLRWRRLRIEVKGVEVGNQWCEDPEVVRREAKKLFEDRFQASPDFGVRLDAVDFKTVEGG